MRSVPPGKCAFETGFVRISDDKSPVWRRPSGWKLLGPTAHSRLQSPLRESQGMKSGVTLMSLFRHRCQPSASRKRVLADNSTPRFRATPLSLEHLEDRLAPANLKGIAYISGISNLGHATGISAAGSSVIGSGLPATPVAGVDSSSSTQPIVLNGNQLVLTANNASSTLAVTLFDSGAVSATVDGDEELFGAGEVGSIQVNGLGGSDSFAINDSTAFPQTYVVTGSTVVRSNAPPIIYQGLANLSLAAGSFGDAIVWQGTAAGTTTTISTGTGTNTINYGNANNTLDSFLGTPILLGQGSNNTINVHDDGSTAPHTYILTGSTFSRDGGTGYSSDVQNANFYAGSGGNHIILSGTAAGGTTTINAGAGGDTVFASDVADGTYRLDAFLGAAVINGVAGSTNLAVGDANLTPHTYVLNGSTVVRDGRTVLSYSGMKNMYFNDVGGDIIDLVGTAAGTTTELDYVGPGDTINIGDANHTLDSFPSAPIVASFGGNTLNILDQASIIPHAYIITSGTTVPVGGFFIFPGSQGQTLPQTFQTYTVTGSSFTRDGLTIDYAGINTANFYCGSGGNTINWQGNDGDVEGSNAPPVLPPTPPPFIPTTVYTGAGIDTVNLGDLNNTLDSFAGTSTLVDQGSNDTLNVNDQGSANGHTYTISGSTVGRDEFTLTYSGGITSLTLQAGSGANTINLQGDSCPLTVATGTGPNTVSAGDDDSTLNGFTSAVTLQAQGVNNTLNVDDHGATTARAYVVNPSSFSDGAGATIAVIGRLQFANYFLGSGANTLNWQGNATGTTYTATFANGSDQVSGSYSVASTLVEGAVTLVSGATASFGELFIVDPGSLDLSQAVGTPVTADSVASTGTIVGAGQLVLTDSGDFNSGNLQFFLGASSNDQVLVGGNTTLSGTLSLSLATGFVPTLGQTFTILFDTGGTVAGKFTGAPSGTIYHLNGVDGSGNPFTALLQISYSGPSVILTAVGPPTIAVDNTSVTVTGGSTATNTGTWSQASLAGADTITASIGSITQTFGPASGTWAWSYPTSTAGTQTVTITASDGQGDKATTTFTLVVNPDPTSLSLVPSVNPSYRGQTVTFLATVAPQVPNTISPNGMVTFSDGSTVLGTEMVVNAVASIPVSTLLLGDHSITASYFGDPNFGGSSTSLTQTVKPYNSTVTVTVAPVQSVFGQTVTITAVVKGVGTTLIPQGTVLITSSDGQVTQILDLNKQGKASFSTNTLGLGPRPISADYLGLDPNFVQSQSAPVTEMVLPDGTVTKLSSSTNPSVFGQKVTFTALVTALFPGSGTPAGQVQFVDSSGILATEPVIGGRATYPVSNLSPGSYPITAVYLFSGSYLGSTSSTVTQTVNQAATTTKVTASPNPSVYGQNVTLTATVSAKAPGAGTPTGTVTFLDGTTTLSTATLTNGTVNIGVPSLPVGSNSITVSYSGDTNFTGSTSAALTQTVKEASTTTKLTSSANPSVYGQSVTFTATVTAKSPGSGTPTGMVTFLDGITTMAVLPLSGGTVAYTPPAPLSVGSHSITVQYASDGNFAASTSSALSQTVHKSATTTTLTSSENPSVFGDNVTFTVTVNAAAPGFGIPSGTVTFKDGSKTLGTGIVDGSGRATFTTSSLPEGSHSLTATYGGDADFKVSVSTPLTQVVNPASNVVVAVLGLPSPAASPPTKLLFAESSLGADPQALSAVSPNPARPPLSENLPPISSGASPIHENLIADRLQTSGRYYQLTSPRAAILDELFAALGQGGPMFTVLGVRITRSSGDAGPF